MTPKCGAIYHVSLGTMFLSRSRERLAELLGLPLVGFRMREYRNRRWERVVARPLTRYKLLSGSCDRVGVESGSLGDWSSPALGCDSEIILETAGGRESLQGLPDKLVILEFKQPGRCRERFAG